MLEAASVVAADLPIAVVTHVVESLNKMLYVCGENDETPFSFLSRFQTAVADRLSFTSPPILSQMDQILAVAFLNSPSLDENFLTNAKLQLTTLATVRPEEEKSTEKKESSSSKHEKLLRISGDLSTFKKEFSATPKPRVTKTIESLEEPANELKIESATLKIA